MKLTFVSPRAQLRPFVRSIWAFQSPTGLPPSDMNLAAPNGCAKLIFQYDNSIISTAGGRSNEAREPGLYLAGNRNNPVLLSTRPGRTGFIGVEFYPHGAYPVFGIPMSEITNRLFPAGTLFPKWERQLRGIVPDLTSVSQRVAFVQDQLVRLLGTKRLHNPFVDYCISSLNSTSGLMSISDLERRTGYSRRYLEILFDKHVGFSPKVLAGIFRFQRFYRKWAEGRPFDELKEELFEYYYDQAHFGKEFKRLTGFSPQHFTRNVANEFGRQLSVH